MGSDTGTAESASSSCEFRRRFGDRSLLDTELLRDRPWELLCEGSVAIERDTQKARIGKSFIVENGQRVVKA